MTVRLLPKHDATSVKTEFNGGVVVPENSLNPLIRKIPTLVPVRLRPRRERPCDQCRQRKTRCVAIEGTNNLCTFCQGHGNTCTFREPPTPRKRRQVETDSLRTLENNRKRKQESLEEHKHHIPKREREQQRDNDSHPIPLKRSQTTSLDAPLLNLCNYNSAKRVQSPFGLYQKVAENNFWGISEVPSHSKDQRCRGLMNEIRGVVGDAHSRLLSLYREYVHPHYPIINWTNWCKQLSVDSQKSCPALLACIYLVALEWWDHASTPSSSAKPDAQRLLDLAYESLTGPVRIRNICTVQAKLLLLLIPECRSWEESCSLVSLAQDIGLHQDCSAWQIPNDERYLRKRIAWAVLIQAKWNAWTFGHPSPIRDDNWTVQNLSVKDFSDCCESSKELQEGSSPEELPLDFKCFYYLALLSKILGDVLNVMSIGDGAPRTHQQDKKKTRPLLQDVKKLEKLLSDWKSKAPTLKDIEKSKSPVTIIPSLILAYHIVDMQLHRILISMLSEPASIASQQLPATFLAEHKFYHDVRDDAKTKLVAALEFINRLSPSKHLRNTFWHSFSADAFASIVSLIGMLTATAPTKEEAFFFAARMKEFRWTINAGAASSSVLCKAIEITDKVSATLRGIHQKPNQKELYDMIRQQQAKLSKTAKKHATFEEMDVDRAPNAVASGGDTEENSEEEQNEEGARSDDSASYSGDTVSSI